MENAAKNEVSVVSKIETLYELAKTDLLEKTIKTPESVDELIKTYSEVEIVDKSSYDFFKKGAKEMRKIASLVNKNRLEITRPIDDFKKGIKEFGDQFIDKLNKASEPILQAVKDFEDKEAAEVAKRLAERCEKLSSNGFNVVGGVFVCGALHLSTEQISQFTDEDMDFHLNIGKAELSRKEAEEKRKAEEKAALEKEREEIATEKAELLKLKEELLALRKEVAKDKEVVDNTIKEKISKPEPDPLPQEISSAEAIAQASTPKEELEKPKDTPKTNTMIGKSVSGSDSQVHENAFKRGVTAGIKIGRSSMKAAIIKEFSDDSIKRTRTEWIEWMKLLSLDNESREENA